MKLKQNSHEWFRKKVALSLAILLHTLLLLIHFKKHLQKPSCSHGIEISMIKIQESIEKHETIIDNNESPKIISAKVPTENTVYVTQKPKPNLKNPEKNITSDHIKTSHTADESVDKRSLYDIDNNNQQKQTAAQLDMNGWEWDSTPHPNDATDEVGKIVFEITIDNSGFVVGIKEKEKNISPQLAYLYKESLANLTFSRTSESTPNQYTIKGTVTFILHSK